MSEVAFVTQHLVASQLQVSGSLTLNSDSDASYTFPTTRGVTGQVLTASNDVVTWADASGGSGSTIQDSLGTTSLTCATPGVIAGHLPTSPDPILTLSDASSQVGYTSGGNLQLSSAACVLASGGVSRLDCNATKSTLFSPDQSSRLVLEDDPAFVEFGGPDPPRGNATLFFQNNIAFQANSNSTNVFSPASAFSLNVDNSGVTVFNHAGPASYSLPTTDGAANQVITTDGFGRLSWVAPPAPPYPSHILTFGGTVQQNQFLMVGGLSTTLSVPTATTGSRFLLPIGSVVRAVSYDFGILTNVPDKEFVLTQITGVGAPIHTPFTISSPTNVINPGFIPMSPGQFVTVDFQCSNPLTPNMYDGTPLFVTIYFG